MSGSRLLGFLRRPPNARGMSAGKPPPYASMLAAQAAYLATRQTAGGAILYADDKISPYFACIAATGLLKAPGSLPAVRAYMGWHVAHINATDIWGLGGTIYDYAVSPQGVQTSLESADSVDSYAAAFLTLARALYDAGDAATQAYVRSLQPTLRQVGNAIVKLIQADGLTIAMPRYPIAYLEDNCEAWRGLSDLARLETAWGAAGEAAVFSAAAARIKLGIATLWNGASGNYAYAKGEPEGALSPSAWGTWYPDAASQLFPALQGVLPASDARAKALYAGFNAAFPRWASLQGMGGSAGGFPWALACEAAAIMGDLSRARTYVDAVQAAYAPAFPWPWYCAEAGWFMRGLAALLGQ